MTNATDTDYAWAAGFIEADGCIHLSQHGHTKIEVIVVQKDRRPIDRLQRIFGDQSKVGVVKRRGGTATYYRVSFGCERAVNLLRVILPYLDHKRDMALLGIQLGERISTWGGARRQGRGMKLPDMELHTRLQIVRQARALSKDAERLSEAAPREQACG
jgi:hypothetical protein